LQARDGNIELSIYEDGVPPEFRLRFLDWQEPVDLAQLARDIHVRTIRSDGRTQVFSFAQQHHHDGYLRSTVDVPEPHSFTAEVQLRGEALQVEFAEDDDSCHHSSHSGHSSHSDGGQSTPNPLHRYAIYQRYVHPLSDGRYLQILFDHRASTFFAPVKAKVYLL
jgi:nickel/cobalt exporter